MRPQLAISLLTLGAVLAAPGCATTSPEPSRLAGCETGAVRLTQDFSTAPGYACQREGEAAFELSVLPEDPEINPSPWYAFDLHADEATDAEVALDYADYRHRYQPRIELEDGHWAALPADVVTVSEDGHQAMLALDIPAGVTRIGAQEVIPIEARADWRAAFADRNGMSRAVIGDSREGRPIEALTRQASTSNAPLIIILGGQHPPEVTGVLGLRAFLDTMFGPHADATVLDAYQWLIIPDLNPDGVEHGHWRHNTGGLDLNRDWGPFTQPETAAAFAAIEQQIMNGHAPFLLLDFHSTRRDVLYTPPDGAALTPFAFSEDWISLIESEWTGDDPAFDRGPSHNVGMPTSKTWFADTYAAPGVTVEYGDNTDRDRIIALSQTAARALTRYLDSQTANSRP
ncbi:M14 family metallopeptidase [Oceanicaulis sp. LC35]|uniref:M14 family metallopeptidase n=1 Tax=Oceanicaulis sp. LC35 TaxID=3349635 RepID=UPI003F82D039